MTGLGEDTYNGGILTAQSETEDWLGNITRTSTYTDAANATTWTVTDTPDSNVDVIQKNIAGYPVQSVSSTAITNSWTYDGFSRQISASDGRTNTNVTAYNDLGQVSYTQNSTNKTCYFYDNLGRRTTVSNALGQVSHTAYDPQGHTIAEWGTSYPVAYQFDAAGRMIALATTRTNDNRNINLNTLVPSGDTLNDGNVSSIDVTRWLYNESTGLLTEKLYADGNGTSYTYTDSGRLATRTWARGVISTYAYNTLGQLSNITYSDNTPDVTFTYDRPGRMTSATSSASTRTFEYTGLALTKEVQDNYIIERIYDNLGRAIGYELYSPDDLINPVQTIIYGYSDNGRFHSVISVNSGVTNQCNYTYLAGTDLISGYTNSAGFASLREYESDRNLITSVSNFWHTADISAFDYSNNALGRRTKRADYFDASTIINDFTYNIFGEVIEAAMGNDTYINDYDPIGNRAISVNPCSSVVTNTYTANNLNQYTAVTEIGDSASTKYYSHDADGNLFSGDGWIHTWNAENRLVQSAPSGWFATNGSMRIESKYNYKNLRVAKIKKQLSGRGAGYPFDPSEPGTWNAIETRKYIWDGFNIAAEIIIDYVTPATNISYYTWGLDLSGTLQGAGGVGGLLCVTKEQSDLSAKAYYAAADANGNITEYIDETGAVKAHIEYSATGEETYKSGTMKDDFTHRFSSKPYDPMTRLVQFQKRPLKPDLSRWLSRDSIGIEGGLNEVGFVNNDAINLFDAYGLYTLRNARTQLDKSGVRKQGKRSVGGGPYAPSTYELFYTDKQIFDQWVSLEQADFGWLSSIPDCPDKICIKNGQPKNCDNNQWRSLSTANQTFHPGAAWCMRSDTSSGSGQQCCYNRQGDLIVAGLGAGTPDRQAASLRNGLYLSHYQHDVAPFNIAWSLDGGVIGSHLHKYLAVRPPSQGGGGCYQ